MTKSTKSGVIIKAIMTDKSEYYVGDFEKYDGQYMDSASDAHIFKTKKIAESFIKNYSLALEDSEEGLKVFAFKIIKVY